MKKAAHKVAYISAGELAAYLSVSVHSVRKMSEDGRLPAPIKLGKLLRWNRDEIMRTLDNAREQPASTSAY